MTALYYPPKFDSGLPGAKLWFYQTNTTTPQNTYTDAALGVASSNPVVADANGVFEPIYLDPTLPNYRVKYTTSADVLLYQVDDVPSNQGVQQYLRLESANPYLFLYDTDGTVNLRKYRIRASGNVLSVELSNDAESVFTTILTATGGVVNLPATATVNGLTVVGRDSGNFTGTLTGFSGTVSGQVLYYKIGSLVWMNVISGITGTSNAATMTMTGIPSAIQPSHITVSKCLVTDSGNANMDASVSIFGGTATFSIAKTNAVSNFVQHDASGFTNSGTKGLASGWSCWYYLD